MKGSVCLKLLAGNLGERAGKEEVMTCLALAAVAEAGGVDTGVVQ